MNQSTSMSDEEIHVKVAELMGWVRKEEIGWWGGYRWYHNGSPVECEAPSFYTDPAAALQLCDRMHSEGWEPMIQRPSGIWHVQFTHKDSWKPDVHKMPVSASDPSLARAVTLCFLAAHSNEKNNH